MSYGSIIRELQVSRKLESELALQKHQQELQRRKVQNELQNLRRSRKKFIENQVEQSRKQYQEKLREDPKLAEQFFDRKKRADKERSKIANADFQQQRLRLLEERNQYDQLDKQFRIVDKSLHSLQNRSKLAQESEDRRIFELETKRATVIRLLEQSKKRQLASYQRAKQLVK